MPKKIFKRKLNPNQEQADLYDKITFLETKIIKKIQLLKKEKISNFLCQHIEEVSLEPTFNNDINYYDKFWKEYMKILILKKHLVDFEKGVKNLIIKTDDIEKKIKERQQLFQNPVFSKLKKNSLKRLKQDRLSSQQGQQQGFDQITKKEHIGLKKQQQSFSHKVVGQDSQEKQFFYND